MHLYTTPHEQACTPVLESREGDVCRFVGDFFCFLGRLGKVSGGLPHADVFIPSPLVFRSKEIARPAYCSDTAVPQ